MLFLSSFTYPVMQAVSDCEHCVHIYHSSAKGMANEYAKLRAKVP